MEITKNVIENMMNDYVKHKKIVRQMEDEIDVDVDLDDDPEYMRHFGYCQAAESWMNAVGVSPRCDYIMDKLYS